MKRSRAGNCYYTALRGLVPAETPRRLHGKLNAYLKANGLLAGACVCHGIVTGQGPIAGERIGHAWIESNGRAIDWSNGSRGRFAVAAYRQLACVDAVVRYTPEQAQRLLIK